MGQGNRYGRVRDPIAVVDDALAGRYLLESPIARGGMATVWRARDDVLARTVAVKILHDHLASDQVFLERFRVEALAAARLSHPNIVSIYDTGAEAGTREPPRHFIVMEFCLGGSLDLRLTGEGPLEPDTVAGLAAEVCEALTYAHRSGVIHRDLKPANVLMTADETLKVADFGIAKAAFARGDVTTTGAILGTVTYLSPEQLRGEEPDPRSDLYSLGVTLYELLIGRPPFQADSELAIAMMHLRETPPTPRSMKAGIPRGLENVVMRALEKDPDKRFSSAEEMRQALEGARSPSSTAILPRVAGRAPKQRRSASGRRSGSFVRRLLPVLLLIGLAVVAGFVLVSQDNPDSTPRQSPDPPAATQSTDAAQALDVLGVTDLDPVDPEHPEEAPLAADGDETTAWTTSTYEVSMEALGKTGVGLVFDLGAGAEVGAVEVNGCGGCALELRASDQTSPTDESLFEVVEQVDSAGDPQPFEFEPRINRFWLVFITTLPGEGTGSASISEVRFFGS